MRRKQLTPLNHHRHRHPLLLHSNCATDRNPLSVLFFCNRIPTFSLSLSFFTSWTRIFVEKTITESPTRDQKKEMGVCSNVLCSVFIYFFWREMGHPPRVDRKRRHKIESRIHASEKRFPVATGTDE